MSSDLFGPVTKDSINVGWIDPDDGYVYGYSICQANAEARRNPGTVFIFRDGNQTIRYLNINEVNNLTVQDTMPSTDECGGINEKKDCGPVRIQIFGGGGIGAEANPIFGKSGGIIAVDVVRGGHGYAYLPQVSARDDCDYGSGAVFMVELGETVDEWQYFDLASDYEETVYCDDWFSSHGRMWGPNGEDLGEWIPSIGSLFDQDPIKAEVIKYQQIVRDIDRAPWFNTRKNRPNRITCGSNTVVPSYNQVTDACFKQKHYDAGHPKVLPDGGWGDWMNQYAISPVPASNAPGTDHAGILFNFEWKVDFPVTGTYKIRGACDNRSKLYFDNKYVYTLGVYTGALLEPPHKIHVKEGVHTLRCELYNIPIKEKVLIGKGEERAKNNKQVTFNVTSSADYGNGIAIPALNIDFKKKYKGKQLKEAATRAVEFGKKYEVITVSPETSEGIRLRTKGENVLQMEESDDMDWSDLVCTASLGKFIEIKGNKCFFVLPAPPQKKKPKPVTPPAAVAGDNVEVRSIFNTIDWIGKANRQLWRTNVYGRGGFINESGVCPFDTNVTLPNNPYAGEHRIVWGNVKFPVDGDYRIRIEVDDNVKLYIGDQVSIDKKGFVGDSNKGTGEYSESHYIKKGTYEVIADLYQKPGGAYGFGSIKGINPMALAIDIEASVVEKEIVVPQPWCNNPMGIAIGIDAPQPPIPQEIPPPQEGRCPPNPIWSTRFPNSSEKWYPVSGVGHQGDMNSPDDPNVWSPFMTRYALSPVPPLDTDGTDSSGVTFTNSWPLDIAFDGYYAVKGLVDNSGSVFVDGKEVHKMQGFKVQDPKPSKFFLNQGRHTISVEVYNKPVKRSFTIRENVFRTLDWQARTPPPPPPAPAAVAATTSVTFRITTDAKYGNSISIPGLGLYAKKGYKGGQLNVTTTKTVESGKIYDVITDSPETSEGIRLRTRGESVLQMEEADDMDWSDLVCSVSKGKFINISGNKCQFVVGSPAPSAPPAPTPKLKNVVVTKNGVTYRGPELFHHHETGAINPKDAAEYVISEDKKRDSFTKNTTPTRWASYMQIHSVSPAFPDLTVNNANVEGVKYFVWENVDFPQDGTYSFKFAADNNGSVAVDDQLITGSLDHLTRMDYGNWKTGNWINARIKKGKRTIRVEVLNVPSAGDQSFVNNPTGFALIVKLNRTIQRTDRTSWKMNPQAASAILISPPCPKKISGKGVVKRIIPPEIGTWDPPLTITDPPRTKYKVALTVGTPIIIDGGLNHDCSVDEIIIEDLDGNDHGTKAKLVCGPFGSIQRVDIIDPGTPYLDQPVWRIKTDTGIPPDLIIPPTLTRDPLDVPPEDLIQVTDLVGLKQTGYYDGRAYYGAVFYQDGVKYAGYYETAGQKIQVYDTLQESIDAQVTTRPSAIQRSGTDVSSNDPNLNIPGTPDNLT